MLAHKTEEWLLEVGSYGGYLNVFCLPVPTTPVGSSITHMSKHYYYPVSFNGLQETYFKVSTNLILLNINNLNFFLGTSKMHEVSYTFSKPGQFKLSIR